MSISSSDEGLDQQSGISLQIFQLKMCVYVYLSCSICVLHASPVFYSLHGYFNNIRWRVQVMKFLITKFSPIFCYVRFLTSKCSPLRSSYAHSIHVLQAGEVSVVSPMQNKQNNVACVNFFVRKRESGRFIVVKRIVKQSPFISNTTNSPKHLSCNLQLPVAGNPSCSLAHVKVCPKYVQKSISDA
jgi:hypothetical protein